MTRPVPPAPGAKIFSRLRLDGSPRYFSSGIAHPRTPTPKVVALRNPLFAAINFDGNLPACFHKLMIQAVDGKISLRNSINQ
jgi:hypothetical protein